jgi:predicted transcriptional regulator
MKKSRFTETQIVSALKKQEAGISTREICRELGVTEATFSTGGPSTVALRFLMSKK